MTNRILNESLLRRAADASVDFLQKMDERHVGARATRDELLRALDGTLTENGEEASRVLDALVAVGDRGTIGSTGPRYFGFVIGGSLPVSVAADWLTTTWDQNSGIYAVSPVASVVEEIAQRWLLELLHLPKQASIGFVTGCQMANFTCLAAARHAVLRNAGWNVEEQGLMGAPAVNLIISAEAHVTIHTAMRMLGFGTKRLRTIPTDGQGRMKADELERAVAGVEGPTIVCAQAGNVNTGAVDPLRRIATAAHARNAWVHVDSAFGLWAAASETRREVVDGIELADSWASDGHKWLNVPYDSGFAIVRDTAAHRASMTVSASYLEQTSGIERDNFDWAPEFSRRARGIPAYAALRTLGRRGVADLVDRLCARARQFADILRREPRVEILNDVVLNQVLVRFGDSDELTREVVSGVQREGTCWLGGTTWQGKGAMRISVSNWATTEQDVERSAEAVVRVFREATVAAR
jgi:glutamate/tyrosine decarboxylase-like PLP-dependent enzyme